MVAPVESRGKTPGRERSWRHFYVWNTFDITGSQGAQHPSNILAAVKGRFAARREGKEVEWGRVRMGMGKGIEEQENNF
jgi:hypothetical protein